MGMVGPLGSPGHCTELCTAGGWERGGGGKGTAAAGLQPPWNKNIFFVAIGVWLWESLLQLWPPHVPPGTEALLWEGFCSEGRG